MTTESRTPARRSGGAIGFADRPAEGGRGTSASPRIERSTVVVARVHSGAEAYAALRARWSPHVRRVADATSYDVRAIDPAGEATDSAAGQPRDARGGPVALPA